MFLIIALFFFFFQIHGKHLSVGDEGPYLRSAARVADGSWIYLGGNYKPIYVALLTVSVFLFGSNDWAGLAVSALFGIANLLLIYMLAMELFGDKKIASLSALFSALTGYFFYYSSVVRPDNVFLFFFLTSMFLYVKYLKNSSTRNLVYLLISVSLSMWVRTTGLFIAAVILLHEAYLFFTSNRKDARMIFKRSSIIIGTVVLFFAATMSIYYLFQPDWTGATISGYNQVSSFQLLDLLLNPLESFNPIYYLITMWNWCIPGMIFLSVVGLFISAKEKKNSSKLLLVWFLFMLVFLSFFPQHRVKIFYPIMPVLTISASLFIMKLRSNVIKYIMITAIVLLALTTIAPLIGYNSSAQYEASEYIMGQTDQTNSSPDKVLTSNKVLHWWYFVYADYFDSHIVKERDNIIAIQDVDSMEKLKQHYDNGFDYIILDSKGCRNMPLSQELLTVQPVKTIQNDIAENDLLFRNHFEQAPFLKEADYPHHAIGIDCNREDPVYANIFIYRTSDVLKAHGLI